VVIILIELVNHSENLIDLNNIKKHNLTILNYRDFGVFGVFCSMKFSNSMFSTKINSDYIVSPIVK